MNDGEIAPEMKQVTTKRNLYMQHSDMPKQTIDNIAKKFSEFDLDGNGLLDVFELTRLFEKLNGWFYFLLQMIIKLASRNRYKNIN